MAADCIRSLGLVVRTGSDSDLGNCPDVWREPAPAGTVDRVNTREAVILIGVQASGKTTFYRQRFFETHIRISLDMLRTRHRERLLLQACFAAQQRFVVDNTNVTAGGRALYIRLAHEAGFRVIGYYFMTEIRAALARNAGRQDKQAIPVQGVIGTYNRFDPPVPDEGFDELYSVRLDAAGGFAVEPWRSPGGADGPGSGES